ncbi:MAG: Na+/H+ antiporter NhaC family protein [Oceanisphaera sp.]|uniref:GntT/GntP/DsdX family permease n=1 Tax=Oceanisphaera sp. TaxID=1929979 RepID=UPI003C778D23
MFDTPTLWGLLPLLVFVVLVFRAWHPVAAILMATSVGAVMSGASLLDVASVTRSGLGSFLAYVGLIIMAGGGLGKIAERTGVAQYLVSIVMNRIGVKTKDRAIIGTMCSSTLLSGALGTLAGANAVVAPVIIPIVARIGLSSSAVAIIFQGAGVTGLFLGPFTPPMITFMELTGLSYFDVLLYASIPVSLVMWGVTYFYVKLTLPKTIINHPYSQEDLAELDSHDQTLLNPTRVKRATYVFIGTLAALIAYGIFIKGGSTFAIVVITLTAITTGLAGGLKTQELTETFFAGAMPLIWLFFQFVLFTPFIHYAQELGGFEALKNFILPIINSSGDTLLVALTSITGIAGIPGAAVAQSVILDEMFGQVFQQSGLPISVYVLVLLIGSQMTEFLYPVGDTLGAMGIARSRDLKSMIIFGMLATIAVLLFVIIRSLFA